MLRHVAGSDRIRHALKAEQLDQPVKQGRGVVDAYRAIDPAAAQVGVDVVDKRW